MRILESSNALGLALLTGVGLALAQNARADIFEDAVAIVRGQLGACDSVDTGGASCPSSRTAQDMAVSTFDALPNAPSSGLGVNQAGDYWVMVEWVSDRRFALRATDGGECGHFCNTVDVPENQCPGWAYIDGVRLKEGDLNGGKGVRYLGGMSTWLDRVRLGGINGPFQKHGGGGTGEWIEGIEGNHCFSWTRRPEAIITGFYKVNWSGQPISSQYQIQWSESDKGLGDDYSVSAPLELGHAITHCLQRVPSDDDFQHAWDIDGAYPGSLYTNICHEVGGCDNPRDFKIETYFNVQCRIARYENDSQAFRLHSTVRQDDVARYGRERDGLTPMFVAPAEPTVCVDPNSIPPLCSPVL